jgi:hypothetical protein
VRTLCPNARFGTNMRLMLLMFGECFAALASVDASRVCRGRRVLREISMTVWFGLAWRFRLLASGPPTPHSTAHRVATLVRAGRAGSYTNIGYGSHVTFYETNPPRRGGPLCPPAQENVPVGYCDDACLAGNGLPLASVDVSRACRCRRMLREISMTVWFG